MPDQTSPSVNTNGNRVSEADLAAAVRDAAMALNRACVAATEVGLIVRADVWTVNTLGAHCAPQLDVKVSKPL